MPGTIVITSQAVGVNGKCNQQFAPGQVTIVQNNIGGHSPVLSIGTSVETIQFGDIGTIGMVCFHNLDNSNFVIIGPDSSGTMVPMIKIKAGEPSGPFRVKPGTVLKAQADTAAVLLQMVAYED